MAAGFGRPKANPIGSTHSLAQLGAISSGNVPNSGSTAIFTRPSPVGPVAPSPININSPILNGGGLPTTPRANPVGVTSAPITSRISTPLGGTRVQPFPVNYPHSAEE